MRTTDPITDADRYQQAMSDAQHAHETRWRARELGDVEVDVDGTTVLVRGAMRPTGATWTDPGEPWEWDSVEVYDGSEVDDDDVRDALEVMHG